MEEIRQYIIWAEKARANLQVITNPNPPEDGAAGVPAAEAPTPVLGGGDADPLPVESELAQA